MINTTPPPPIRVIMADDHYLMREGITSVLAEADGIELVGQACNGQDAVELFIQLLPDVTLMDLQMPLLNGFDAIMSIRAMNKNAHIIAVTAHKGDCQIRRALSAGCTVIPERI